MSHYDVLIVGAGVASASALIPLSQSGFNIAAVAPADDGAFRVGETLAPSAQSELEALGLWQAFAEQGHYPVYSKYSIWGEPQVQEKYAWKGRDQHSWALDRTHFQARMWDRAKEASHFTSIEAKVVRAEYQEEGWTVYLSTGEVVQTRLILDGSGRSGVVARNHLERQRLDKLVGIYTVLDQQDGDIEPTVGSMVEAMPEGWWYSALVPNRKLVLTYFTDSDLLPAGEHDWSAYLRSCLAASEFTALRQESAGFGEIVEAHITDAATQIASPLATTRLLAMGDAAASFDPLSSHGITTALWSGRMAAQAVQSLLVGEKTHLQTYISTFSQGISRYLEQRTQMYGVEQRYNTHVFWQRRHAPAGMLIK